MVMIQNGLGAAPPSLPAKPETPARAPRDAAGDDAPTSAAPGASIAAPAAATLAEALARLADAPPRPDEEADDAAADGEGSGVRLLVETLNPGGALASQIDEDLSPEDARLAAQAVRAGLAGQPLNIANQTPQILAGLAR